jgi:hypothetical protein
MGVVDGCRRWVSRELISVEEKLAWVYLHVCDPEELCDW